MNKLNKVKNSATVYDSVVRHRLAIHRLRRVSMCSRLT